ncbi:MAG TPA: ABC transporter permease [Symbiobacteriaceae bacterium]|nr:ABC transporter permease [Symbiobacteriaceae bacterium]
MHKALTIALLQLKTTFKSKGSIVTMFAMPLLLTLIFGVLTQGGGTDQTASKGAVFPVAVLDYDDSFASRRLTEMLKAEENLTVRIAASEAEINKLFADVKVTAAVIIPQDFQKQIAAGESPEVKLLSAPGGNDYQGVAPIVRWQVPRLARDYQLALRSVADGSDSAAVEAAYAKISAERQKVSTTVVTHQVTRNAVKQQTGNLTAASHASVGFTVTFVMMQVFMMSGVILIERKQGTWGRLLTSPSSRVTIISGYLMSFFLTGMVQFAILVFATRFFFHVNWGPLLPLFTMGAATVLSASGMGLFLAGLVKTFEQQISIGILFINATAMLGGAYWDIAMVGKTMQRIGYLTPQAWAIDGFKEIMLRGGSWDGIVLPLAVLLCITLVFMTGGLLRVRYE